MSLEHRRNNLPTEQEHEKHAATQARWIRRGVNRTWRPRAADAAPLLCNAPASDGEGFWWRIRRRGRPMRVGPAGETECKESENDGERHQGRQRE